LFLLFVVAVAVVVVVVAAEPLKWATNIQTQFGIYLDKKFSIF